MGLPNAEVELAASLLVHEGDPNLTPMVTVDRPRLSTLYAAGRYALDPNVALGAELGVSGPTTDFPTYQPRAVIATRRHLARSSAVDVRFATGFDKYSSDGPPQIPTIFVASLRARVIAQPSPNFAAEIGATLSYFKSTGDESTPGFFTSAQSTSYAVRFIATPSRVLDIVFGAELPSTKAITAFIGIAARRLP
jgi:hypothetical protein